MDANLLYPFRKMENSYHKNWFVPELSYFEENLGNLQTKRHMFIRFRGSGERTDIFLYTLIIFFKGGDHPSVVKHLFISVIQNQVLVSVDLSNYPQFPKFDN